MFPTVYWSIKGIVSSSAVQKAFYLASQRSAIPTVRGSWTIDSTPSSAYITNMATVAQTMTAEQFLEMPNQERF
jgi:hypothetical protein